MAIKGITLDQLKKEFPINDVSNIPKKVETSSTNKVIKPKIVIGLLTFIFF
jgi:hypothetical protein